MNTKKIYVYTHIYIYMYVIYCRCSKRISHMLYIASQPKKRVRGPSADPEGCFQTLSTTAVSAVSLDLYEKYRS